MRTQSRRPDTSAPSRYSAGVSELKDVAGQRPASGGMIPAPLRVGSELAARLLVIAAALAVIVWLVIQLRVVVVPVAIALLLAALLAPVVHAATDELRIPRGPACGLVLVTGIALVSLVLSGVINAFVAGLPELRDQLFQSYEQTIKPLLAGPPLRIPEDRLNDLAGEVQRSVAANSEAVTSGALSTAASLAEVISGALLALFVLIFFLYDGARIWAFLVRVVPSEQRVRVHVAGQRAFASLVGYTRATVAVAVVDAVGIGIGLWAVGTPLVVPLAALVFLGAFIPVVGAVLSGGVALLITLVAMGPVQALVVLGVVIAVMQLESHVLQPILLGRAVQLHPLAVVLAVAGGVVIAGITGALVAVPLVAVLSTGIRSLIASGEPHPQDVDPLDPMDAKAGQGEPKPVRRLRTLAAAAKDVIGGRRTGFKPGRRRRPRPEAAATDGSANGAARPDGATDSPTASAPVPEAPAAEPVADRDQPGH
jgi:putative heme transporter